MSQLLEMMTTFLSFEVVDVDVVVKELREVCSYEETGPEVQVHGVVAHLGIQLHQPLREGVDYR